MPSCHGRHMPGQTDGTAHDRPCTDRPQREADRPRPRHDHRRMDMQTDMPQARHDHMHIMRSRRTWRAQTQAHAYTRSHMRAQVPHDTPHVNTPPREGGYPRIKNKAAGPLVLTLNTPQTIFELRVTHEIFTRIGHATVVAPVGVSRIHLG